MFEDVEDLFREDEQFSGVHIYFGSQTGTAESFAQELGHETRRKGIKTEVLDLEHFSSEIFVTHPFVVLVVATTGEGDPTDNASKFFSWVSDPRTPADCLASMSFAVFGLGDRNYVNFNQMGELTDANLERLGAHRINPRGIGDDSGDIVQDFQMWKQTFWPVLEKRCQSSDPVTAGDSELVGSKDPVLKMATSLAGLPAEPSGQPADAPARWFFEGEMARVSSITELRKSRSIEEGSSTVHIELKIFRCSGLSDYTLAGNLEILPENDPADIAEIMPLLGISEAAKPGDVGDLDCCITFAPHSSDSSVRKPFPTPCSLRDALARYCGLRSAPTRRMLVALRTQLDPLARDCIDRLLASPSAMKIVQDKALALTQCEFWTMFGVDQLDLASFLLHCPRQRPRPYTIASSPNASPDEIHLCASLASRPAETLDAAVAALKAKGVLPAGCTVPTRPDRWFGLCSHWMCSRLQAGDIVTCRARASVFKLLAEDVPVMMVGAGAGVAPFRAFWSELRVRPPRTMPAILFFGCRHPDKDWIYAEEMKALTPGDVNSESQPLSEVVLAFSRQGEGGEYDASGNCGEYVQDQMRARSRDVRGWIEQGGTVYVCGSNPVCQGVLDVLGEILNAGSEELQTLRQEQRIVVEFWSDVPRAAGEGWHDEDDTGIDAGHGTATSDETATAAAAAEAAGMKLLEAVKNGNHPEVNRLIEAGTDVNFQAGSRKYTRIGLRQEVGETALHWAALRGDDVVADVLLSAGADPDLRDQDGKAPLHIASFNGVLNVSRRLLESRCDVNACDKRGNTAMQWVILAGGSVRMIKLLLKHGARGDVANEDGEYPADVAEEQGSDAVADLIRAAMDAG